MKKVGGNKLAAMNFAELEAFFTQATGSEQVAVEMAKGFKLAVISKRKNALQNWLKQTLTPAELKQQESKQENEERVKILDEYKSRISEIRAEYAEKKITNKERIKKEKIAKEVKETKERDPLTPEQKAKRNITRLQTRLEEIKMGKVRTTEKRELTSEERSLHTQIDAEMAKLSAGVEKVHPEMEQETIERALGYSISPTEVSTINTLAARMEEASLKKPDNMFTGFHSDYFKAKDALNSYLDNVNPLGTLDVLTRVIFRGNLLFGIKSVVTNIVGNVAGGISEKAVSAAVERRVTGANSELVMPYIKYAMKTYKETGIDIVRVLDAGEGDRTVLGEHFQTVGRGRNPILAYGRFVDQYVFRIGQGLPDIGFAALHFADNVNMLSSKIADAKGLKGEAHKREAARLFLLATSLSLDPMDPRMAQAYQIKQSALQYALTATYQNTTQWSETMLKARSALDEYTGALNLGTNVVPFVKTLVNIAKLSIEMTGVTLPIELPRLAVAYHKGDAETLRRSINVIVRAGFGILLASMLASLLDDDDYLPDYTLASDYQKELAKLSNASYNSIRIGDKWVSLAYFGTFGYALAGMLGARQKQTVTEGAMSYYMNTAMQLRQTPVIQQILNTYDYMNDAKKYNKNADDLMGEAIANVANFFTARSVPAIVGDIAKGTDTVERYTQYGPEGIADQLKAKIPFWRETLPPKYNAMGETIPTEAFYWVILTGARVKTAPKDTAVYSELTKLSVSGEDVKIKLDTYKQVKIAKKILTGKEYNELTGELQRQLMNAYANTMATTKYQEEEDPEKRKKYLMDEREEVVKKVIREMGYYEQIRQIEREEKRK